MKCKKCNAEVSIADSKCPHCGNDLLQFGATSFYEPKAKETPRYGQTIRDMIFHEVGKDVKGGLRNLDPWERKIFLPFENRLKALFARHISDMEIDNFFENEIFPAIDALSKERPGEKIFRKVEEQVRSNLGNSVFQYYENIEAGKDVLRILRAGEITCIVIRENTGDIDLSVKTFPFFKASEVSCRLHSKERYACLRDDPTIKEIVEWVGDKRGDVFIEGVPDWGQNPLLDVIEGFPIKGFPKGRFSSDFLRTAVSICALGKDSTLRIERGKPPKVREFNLSNPFKAKGSNEDKELLTENLRELNKRRNEGVHQTIENDEKNVQERRSLSYDCLKRISKILEI